MPKWRNGRRTRLKILRGQLHVGSSPTFGTTNTENGFDLFFLFILLNQGTFTLYSGPRRLRRHPKYTTFVA